MQICVGGVLKELNATLCNRLQTSLTNVFYRFYNAMNVFNLFVFIYLIVILDWTRTEFDYYADTFLDHINSL